MTTSFEDFLRDRGFLVVKSILADGNIHRFGTRDKPKGDSGWAMLFPEGNAGMWGDWRTSDGSKYWNADGRGYKELSYAEKRAVREQQVKYKAIRDADHEAHAVVNLASYEAIEHHPDIISPYLKEKQVGAYGVKVDADGVVYFPLKDITGKFFNYQSITKEKKLFQKGRVSGCFHLMEGDRQQIIITSGYATGASIHEATGLCVVVCGGDTNMLKVAAELRAAKYQHIAIACDNDSGGSESGNKVAQKAIELGFSVIIPKTPGDFNDLAITGVDIYPYFFKVTPAFSYRQMLADKTPMPEDVVAPRIITEGGMLVFGGAPKVGKSDFILAWLLHMAAGIPFMGMEPSKPLRVFYLQAEVQYHYMRERINNVEIPNDLKPIVDDNFFVTPQVRMLLDESGVKVIGNTIRQHFGKEKPDIICLDPITNLYDQESENDNAQMMKFLAQRVEPLRAYAKESTAFVLVHHTKKISVEELAKDPFQMFAGASSLRRYYTTGMLMYRPDETVSECILTYEARNGPRMPNINVDKDKMTLQWKVIPKEESRINKGGDDGDGAAKERQRKIDIIKDELIEETGRDKDHTIASLSLFLADKHGLGSSRTIERFLKELVAQSEIQTFKKDGDLQNYLQP